MSDAPILSVIVPLHQGGEYIADTLTSIQRQTVDADVEVVVVDDASSDDGPEIAAGHPVAPHVVRQEHAGVAVARNRGSLVARGRWLAYVDQDDLWHESRLERLLPVLEQSGAGCVLTTLRSFGVDEDRPALHRDPQIEGMVDTWVPAGTELDRLCGASMPLDLSGSAELRRLELADVMSSTVSPTTSFVIRADHLRLVGGWSPHARSIDDWWLMASAAYVEPILVVDQPTHLYRIHSQATSRSTNFFYPYASSLVAMRFGGSYVDRHTALSLSLENPSLVHMLRQMMATADPVDAELAARFTREMSGLLRPQTSYRRELMRARVQRHAPWLLSAPRLLNAGRGARQPGAVTAGPHDGGPTAQTPEPPRSRPSTPPRA